MAESDSKLRQLADELRDADDEITAEQFINVEPGGNVTVVTGKHQAMTKEQADEVTPTDPPSRTPAKAKFALAVLDRIQPPWLRAPVVIVALCIFGLLLWRGVALAGLLP